MPFKTWGEPLLTADATNTRVYNPMTFSRNVLIKAMRFRLVFNNDPTLTSIGGRLYSDDAGMPGGLIANSSDTRTKAELTTQGNGVVESYVLFDDVHIRKDTQIHFLLTLNGYVGTTSSHVAFEKCYPDPVILYSGFGFKSVKSSPFYCYPITSIL